jgi:hypothetical protein
MTRALPEYETACELIAQGLRDGEIGRRLGIPRRTVNGWRRVPRRRRTFAEVDPAWRPPNRRAYCYALGQYLGDGHIAFSRGGAPFLRISMDTSYPEIVTQTVSALKATFPAANVLVLTYRPEVRIVQVSERSLAVAFPQHGPGKKHLRPIELTEWQLHLTHTYPAELLKGLLHSDGSRCINRFGVPLLGGRVGRYEYPRYFFTNYSAHIRRIFCDHCEMLGIRWTQSNPRNISVSHRESVAILDAFVGPKR